jgi:hypothetical protein
VKVTLTRFDRVGPSKFARWYGTGAVALSSGEGKGLPVRHRLDFGGNRRINSVLYIASVTRQRDIDEARVYIDRKVGEGETRREARRSTNDTSPTASSDAQGISGSPLLSGLLNLCSE